MFSVSKELELKIENAGLNLDAILSNEMKKVMKEFENEFHKGDEIGYAWGVHHDTDNRHIHLFLSNRTARGKHVAMSNPLKNRSSKYAQKDQIGYIKERLVRAELRMLNKVIKSKENIQSIKIEDIKIKPETIQEKIENKKFNKQKKFQFKTFDEKVMEKQERNLKVQKQNVSNGKEEIKSLQNEYNLRKVLIEKGMDDIDRLNNIISEEYAGIKKVKSVIPLSVLNKISFVSRSRTLRALSNVVKRISRTETQNERDKIIEKININKLNFPHFFEG